MPARPPVSRLALLVASVAVTALPAAPSLAETKATAPVAAPARGAGDAASAAASGAAAQATTGGEKRAPVRAARKIAPNAPFTGADIETATYDGSDLPNGRSPITAKVQVLLDRSGISPGVTDGFKGGMSESALRAFERQRGLPIDGLLDADVWAQLQAFAAPRSEGLWREVRAGIADSIEQAGGSTSEAYTELGNELRATLPGGAKVRFVGVDGPRWFLRGVLAEDAVSDEAVAADFVDILRGTVVNRGESAMPPREVLVLSTPSSDPEDVEVEESEDLNPFERGPEITEVR